MARFVEGEDRAQSTLFPERLDDYIAEDNPVRVIEAFVDALAEFRKTNGKGIGGVCREFVGVCRRLELFTQAVVAIDGSKFKALSANVCETPAPLGISVGRWR